MRLFETIFLTVGLILLAVAVFLFGRSIFFRVQATQVIGTVTEVRLVAYADGNAYCPTVRYTTSTHEVFTHYSDVCSFPASYKQGDEVRIFYDPLDPEDARLDNFFGFWFAPLLLGFLGVIFAGIGAFLLFPSQVREKLNW